ncbi:MAG: PhoH family protein, partial [Bacteroidales bacterium]|nr:PhoH family protein [Bacteroidales bacterium]
TGDVTQVDLPPRQSSGLLQAENILKKVDGISFVRLDARDVVRHKLVAKIIAAYAEEKR